MQGVARRLERFFVRGADGAKRCLILALDHGAADGMLPGLERTPDILKSLSRRTAQAVVLNKGLARAYGEMVPGDVQLVVQLSAGTRHGLPDYNQSLVCAPAEALRLGADAVCVNVNLGNDLEDRMLSDLGGVVDEAHLLGLPVFAVIYARGGQIIRELDPSLVAHCVRLGGEIGADVVCSPYSGDPASYERVVRASPIPVLVAGGPKRPSPANFSEALTQALACGASGAIIGRNVFQSPDPLAALEEAARTLRIDGSAK